jgi:hypothetical protein
MQAKVFLLRYSGNTSISQVGNRMKNRLLLFLLIVMVGAGCAGDGKARIVFDNQSACGTIPITLTNSNNPAEIIRAEAPQGKRTEVIVTPNTFYEYFVDFSGAGENPDGFRCTAQQKGKLNVPANSSQTFTLIAQTPVPTQ